MSLFVTIGSHIIRKSQIVRVINRSYCPYPASRPYHTESERVVVLRDGSRLSTGMSLGEIDSLLNPISVPREDFK